MPVSKPLAQLGLKGLAGGRARKPGRIELTLDAVLAACNGVHRWHDPRLRESTMNLYGRALLQYERRPDRGHGPGLGACSPTDAAEWLATIQEGLSQTSRENFHAAFQQWFQRRDGEKGAMPKAPRENLSGAGQKPGEPPRRRPGRMQGQLIRLARRVILGCVGAAVFAIATGHWDAAMICVLPPAGYYAFMALRVTLPSLIPHGPLNKDGE